MSHEPEPRPLSLPTHTDAVPEREEIERLREQTVSLRNRLLAHSAVTAAQGVLLGRYRLSSLREAFDLLRRASQRHNIKLHTLADAVVRVPGPDADAAVWFPRRARTGPPALPGLNVPETDRRLHGAVLNAALQHVLHITQTGMGNVQLAEGGVLRLEKHAGLDRQFTDFFAFVDGPSTACGQAAEQGRQVTVRDVATATVFDEESRRAILRAGSRACHSVPLVGHKGALTGVISSHHARPLPGFTRQQLDALEETGTSTGRWLSWHRRTVLLDALEHLHSTAIHQR